MRWIKYMKRSAPKSVKNGYLNLELLSHTSCLTQLGIFALEWLRLVSNLIHKLLQHILQVVSHNFFQPIKIIIIIIIIIY